MHIIPVIDLMGGRVVHARHGERARYRPLQSPLCRSSRPRDVVDGLLELWPFPSLYIADLDAIQGRGHHRDAIRGLRARYPALELWVDAGLSGLPTLETFLADDLGRPVLGSESLGDLEVLDTACARDAQPVLSLDFRDGRFLGPEKLRDQPEYWPRCLVIMTLARVGASQGPDWPLLREYRRRAPQHVVYAAGGVRDKRDLEGLAKAGIDGALVATALHAGRIGREALQACSNGPMRNRP